MEIELKFQLTAVSRKAIEAQLRAKGGRSKQLAARYFDTPVRELSQAGLSLRLRKEGSVWFQTLKSASTTASAVRGEHNVRLGAVAEPQVDPARHLDTESGNRLARLLSRSADSTLASRYLTDIRRLALRVGSRTCVEYALDNGEIRSQLAGSRRQCVLPVCEIEIELVSGPVTGLITAARKLLREHEVWIDVRSKAQRGDALANGSLITTPVRSRPLTAEGDSLKALIEATLAECVRQVLLNASQLAAVEGGDAGHIHQLRVGLRRLCTAVSLFKKSLVFNLGAWDERAKSLASSLGTNRDIDMISESLGPRLREVGAPLFEILPSVDIPAPASLIRAPEVQHWLMDLLALELLGVGEVCEGAWTQVLPTIRHWYRRCRKDALKFDSFDAGRRHRLRKRLKRLRYALEFIASELPPKRYRRFAKALNHALECMGEYNDLLVAMQRYRGVVDVDPRAWFAVGWLQAQLPKAEARSTRALLAFRDVEPLWLDVD